VVVDVVGDAHVFNVGVVGEVAGMGGVDEAVPVEVTRLLILTLEGGAEHDDVHEGFTGGRPVAGLLRAVVAPAGTGQVVQSFDQRTHRVGFALVEGAPSAGHGVFASSRSRVSSLRPSAAGNDPNRCTIASSAADTPT